jgi:hypothetical protein
MCGYGPNSCIYPYNLYIIYIYNPIYNVPLFRKTPRGIIMSNLITLVDQFLTTHWGANLQLTFMVPLIQQPSGLLNRG